MVFVVCVWAMCLCSVRNNLLRTLEHPSGAVLLQDVREGIPDLLPIAGVSEAKSSGQAGGEGTTETLHAEQRGLEFVRGHGGGCGGVRWKSIGFERRSLLCCSF